MEVDDSFMDRMFENNSPMPMAYAPNQVTDNGNTRFNIWRSESSSDARVQRQGDDEHLAVMADSQRRLHAMMYNNIHANIERCRIGVESNGGGDDDSSSVDSVVVVLAAGEEADGTEE